LQLRGPHFTDKDLDEAMRRALTGLKQRQLRPIVPKQRAMPMIGGRAPFRQGLADFNHVEGRNVVRGGAAGGIPRRFHQSGLNCSDGRKSRSLSSLAGYAKYWAKDRLRIARCREDADTAAS
jgi:hypothetical protein